MSERVLNFLKNLLSQKYKSYDSYSFMYVSMLVTVVLCIPTFVMAEGENSQILSVTPPLFQLSILPGDIWQSSIKVVNGNNYPLTVYTEVVNFSADGEAGQGKFAPILNEQDTDKTTFASWINVSKGPYTIPAEQTQEISFFVEVPKDASPGGHYAAVIISTEEPAGESGKLAVKTSQSVTSLFFVRIEGDVVEEATIREFRVIDSLVPSTKAEFSLRFENKGNVHLQPRGDIVITNMWGTERGKIPVNYLTNYGNVLPSSIRDFKFSWTSDFSMSDIGRYKANVTLAYGESGIKNISATAYFWVLPLKATFITLAVLVSCILLIVWIVRLYIRRMLALAGVDVHAHEYQNQRKVIQSSHVETSTPPVSRIPTYTKVSAPLRNGVLDLRNKLRTSDETVSMFRMLLSFVVQYKLFFISIAVLVCIFFVAVMYIRNATDENKNYEITIDQEK